MPRSGPPHPWSLQITSYGCFPTPQLSISTPTPHPPREELETSSCTPSLSWKPSWLALKA